ncbi:hypothetical protein DRO26_02100 [Candidatus Bathyarchaeota archaeon]|nr:MAG: hypothetical protein DRO26_02100 [Candidatus Bathyarchaeota archaeon]
MACNFSSIIFIILLVAGFMLVGDSLRDLPDPRTKFQPKKSFCKETEIGYTFLVKKFLVELGCFNLKITVKVNVFSLS